MLKLKSSTEPTAAEVARAGVRIERDRQRYGAPAYVGTPDAMIAAGLLRREQIPGEPGCPKVKVFRFEREGCGHIVSLFRHRTLVKLHPGPRDECAQYEAERAREDARCDARRVAADAEKSVGGLPRTRDAYEQIVRLLTSPGAAGVIMLLRRRCPIGGSTVRESLLMPIGGYSLPEHAVDEFEQAVAEAVDELLEHARFSRAARDRQIAAYRQEAADADPDFAQFMQAASARPE